MAHFTIRNTETQSKFHVWTEEKKAFLERIHTVLFFSRYLVCSLFFVCPPPPARFIICLSLFCSMPWDADLCELRHPDSVALAFCLGFPMFGRHWLETQKQKEREKMEHLLPCSLPALQSSAAVALVRRPLLQHSSSAQALETGFSPRPQQRDTASSLLLSPGCFTIPSWFPDRSLPISVVNGSFMQRSSVKPF